ncbi:MAG: hypothetical protein B7Y80_05960 [Hyphomicrobium sp. 32-62-53]|jgi:uncharacterized protein (UPF0371 family)|nr:MAG: hypothetical protein B7Z29_11690 [Hyphomicrobium sp. 12-62-95]OYY00771.1 MAG: hypothetical protein B7Y80_05960 [Hyphomicrobium sp. 32-62-53]
MQQSECKPPALPSAVVFFNGLAGKPVPPDPVRGMIEATVGQVFNILLEDLGSTNRGPARVALARQVAMYLTHVACGLTLTDVGRLFARDRTTVAHACAVVEDLRDDAKFDRVLDLVEMIVRFQLQSRDPRSAA